VHDGRVEVAVDEDVDSVVESGREEQTLTLGRGLVEDSLHDRKEAEVGHVVFETSRAGDHDVDTALKGLHLRVRAHATVDHDVCETEGFGQRIESFGHLGGEFAGGYEDQTTRLAGLRSVAVGRQTGDEREREGEGVTASGTTATDDVATGE